MCMELCMCMELYICMELCMNGLCDVYTDCVVYIRIMWCM